MATLQNQGQCDSECRFFCLLGAVPSADAAVKGQARPPVRGSRWSPLTAAPLRVVSNYEKHSAFHVLKRT